MEKFFLQKVGLFFASLFLLASCMGEGRNIVSGQAFGVVRFDFKSGKNLLDVSEIESFYHIRFQEPSAHDGDCFYVSYEIDYDAPENSYENIEANGFIIADIFDKADVDRWPLSSNPFASDTSKAMIDEMPIITPIWDGDFVYLKGLMFIISALEMPTDRTLYWHLTYDRDNAYSELNGQTIINLFLRATIRMAGTKSKDKTGVANAFEMNHFFTDFAEKVKESGGRTFKIRFNYPSEISDDGQIKWEYQDTKDIQIEYFIPNG